MQPTLGAPQVFPAEVAANRRRVLTLCAVSAVLPALLLGALLAVTVSVIVGVVAFVVAGAAVMYVLWRIAPSVALNRIGAVPIEEQDETRLWNVTEGLCATFGSACRRSTCWTTTCPTPARSAATPGAPSWW